MIYVNIYSQLNPGIFSMIFAKNMGFPALFYIFLQNVCISGTGSAAVTMK